VPAVNLVAGSPRPSQDRPAWLVFWLPNERRYATLSESRDVEMYLPERGWADIVAQLAGVCRAEVDCLAFSFMESLNPLGQYPFIEEARYLPEGVTPPPKGACGQHPFVEEGRFPIDEELG
jgi:hypothetical protein